MNALPHNDMSADAFLAKDRANFQVFRRTYSTLSRQQGIDPKTVADQCGHGLGVNLDVYTRVPLEDRYEAVRKLEKAVLVN